MDTKRRALLAKAYPESPELTKAFMLVMLSKGGEGRYFDMLIAECESEDEMIRNAAYVSLKNVATEKDIHSLINLLDQTEEKHEIVQVQQALANAANMVDDPEDRAELILKALKSINLFIFLKSTSFYLLIFLLIEINWMLLDYRIPSCTT